MRHSVLWKIIIALLVVITLAEVVLLFVLYKNTYEHEVEEATEKIKYVASTTAHALEGFDPDKLEDYKLVEDYLNDLCKGSGVTYLYVIKPDLQTRDEMYLVKGYGKNASEEYINNRYTGYVAKGKLRDEQIKAMNGEELIVIHDKNQYDDTLICYTPIKRYWSTQKSNIVDEIKSLVCAEVSVTSVMESFNKHYLRFVIVILSVTVFNIIAIGVILFFKISRPLGIISARMRGFVSDKSKAFEKLPVKGKDEIAGMSDAFNTMAQDIDRYISELSDYNRHKAELNIARKIQMGLLGEQSFHNEKVSIEASITTAKVVGGDLYDYRILENGNVFVAIADVSGKGITSALFMSRALALLRQFSKLGYSPAKILFEYNRNLAEYNPNMIFITTFVAVFDPKTGELVYSNAGHNYPYILSDKLIILDKESGIAAGAFEDTRYHESVIRLKQGDKLFLFTDGVTEAQNNSEELFGEDRLEKILRDNLNSDAEDIVKRTIEGINKFTDGAVQSDDITLMVLQVNPDNVKKLHLEAKVDNLQIVNQMICELDVPQNTQFHANVIAEEVFVNICSYAYPDSMGYVDIEAEKTDKTVILTFTDSGIPFDQTENIIDINEYDMDNAIGGLGRYISFTLASDYSYERADDKNILKIKIAIKDDTH